MVKDSLQVELDKYYSYGNDRFVRYTHRLRIDQIQKLISRFSSPYSGLAYTPKALDAGCSYGVYSIMLAEAGYDVFGIDINENEIKRARQWTVERGLQNKISLELGDIRKISHGDCKFDLVVCSEVLEHLDKPIVGARELHRVLKKSGTAIISMPNMACLYGLLQSIYRKSGFRSFLGKPPLDLHQIQHSRYWFGNITRLLKDAGFHIGYTSSTSYVPYLWDMDNFVEKLMEGYSLGMTIDRSIGMLQIFKRLGFNFITVAYKTENTLASP